MNRVALRHRILINSRAEAESVSVEKMTAQPLEKVSHDTKQEAW